MSTPIRTLGDIENETQMITKRRHHLEAERAKLDEEIGDLNIKLTHLEIQKERLKDLEGGTDGH